MADGWISPEEARHALRTGEGAGVKIAVIDSGVEEGHPGLGGLRLADNVAVTTNAGRPTVEDGVSGDSYGHGTAVAGVIRRTAPMATIGSFRVLRPNGVPAEPAAIHGAVCEAVRRGYHVINCSFGAPASRRDVLTFKDWIDRAYLAGTHVVAACSNVEASRPEWPSHFASVISVSAVEATSGELFYRPGELVEFGACGEIEDAPWKGGHSRHVMGSSFAAPVASALVARLLSEHPDLSPPLVKALLREVAQESSR